MISRIPGSLLFVIQNQNILCVWEQNGTPKCGLLEEPAGGGGARPHPRYDSFEPRPGGQLYRCSETRCERMPLNSISQVSAGRNDIRICYRHGPTDDCEPVRYHHLDTDDKIKFLNTFNEDKYYYPADCLVYENGSRTCVKATQSTRNLLRNLLDFGGVLRQRRSPGDAVAASLERLVCEESFSGAVRCDSDAFVPYADGLRTKDVAKVVGNVELKTDSDVVALIYRCVDFWCHYRGESPPAHLRRLVTDGLPPAAPTRRSSQRDRIFRCYSANQQLVCKEIKEQTHEVDSPFSPIPET